MSNEQRLSNSTIEQRVLNNYWEELTNEEMLAYTGNDPVVKERINKILSFQFTNATFKLAKETSEINRQTLGLRKWTLVLTLVGITLSVLISLISLFANVNKINTAAL